MCRASSHSFSPFIGKSATNLLANAAYRTLEPLGEKSGKGPQIRPKLGADLFDTGYDFLRHASSNPHSGIDFPPSLNAPILFDAVTAFDRIFGNLTMYMRTFFAYFVLHPEPDPPDPQKRENLLKYADVFLPKGITLDEAMKLGRIEFFAKLTEMFAVQYGTKPNL